MATLNKTEQKIDSFSSVLEGWHFGEGIPPKELSIQTAKQLNRALIQHGLSETDAFFGASGEIQVNGYEEDIYVELIIGIDNKIEFVYERNNQIIFQQDDLSLTQTLAKIQYWGRKWDTLESFTKTTTTIRERDLQQLLSMAQAGTVVYRFFPPSVSNPHSVQYADIFTDTTPQYQVSPRYLSNSPKTMFLMHASS